MREIRALAAEVPPDARRREPPKSDRLLVLACSATKTTEPGAVPAIRRYDGPLWRTLRAADPEGKLAQVAYLSARHGFGEASTPLDRYDARMTPELAQMMIAGGLGTRWPRPKSWRRPETGRHAGAEIAWMARRAGPERRFREVAFVGGRLYLDVMRAFLPLFREAGHVAPDARVVEINAPIGLMRRDLRAWIEAGRPNAEPEPCGCAEPLGPSAPRP